MQFMEPLGATDGSVEAAWDHISERWRDDVVAVTKELGPPMMRSGGIFADFYRWREGVGPREARPAMVNLLWGGVESNQIGTGEFVDFCRQVGADPLICVNFESDGRQHYTKYRNSVRMADAAEAAAWVSYCNDPSNAERRRHGIAAPLGVRHWQIGNETSYDRNGFDLETAGRKTVEFAKAMRAADPAIQLIGWGDSGWASRMAEVAGEHLQFLAFHHMFDPDNPRQPMLRGEAYRRDPEAAWDQLMKAWETADAKIKTVRQSLGAHTIPLAMTECHFVIPGRDRGDVVASWAAGVCVRARAELPRAARRRPQDCDSGGLLRHALAEQCGHHPDAEEQHQGLSAAGGTRHAALSWSLGHARPSSGPNPGRPRRDRQPAWGYPVSSRGKHAATRVGEHADSD